MGDGQCLCSDSNPRPMSAQSDQLMELVHAPNGWRRVVFDILAAVWLVSMLIRALPKLTLPVDHSVLWLLAPFIVARMFSTPELRRIASVVCAGLVVGRLVMVLLPGLFAK